MDSSHVSYHTAASHIGAKPITHTSITPASLQHPTQEPSPSLVASPGSTQQWYSSWTAWQIYLVFFMFFCTHTMLGSKDSCAQPASGMCQKHCITWAALPGQQLSSECPELHTSLHLVEGRDTCPDLSTCCCARPVQTCGCARPSATAHTTHRRPRNSRSG